jgi:hypothetical protein
VEASAEGEALPGEADGETAEERGEAGASPFGLALRLEVAEAVAEAVGEPISVVPTGAGAERWAAACGLVAAEAEVLGTSPRSPPVEPARWLVPPPPLRTTMRAASRQAPSAPAA